MIRNLSKKSHHLKSFMNVSMVFARLSVPGTLPKCRIAKLSQRQISTSSTSVDVYSRDLFDYFRKLHDVVSTQEASWPPVLLEFFGKDPKSAIENLSVIISDINALDESVKSLSDVEKLEEEVSLDPNSGESEDFLLIAEDEKHDILKNIARINERIVETLMSLAHYDQSPINEITLEVSAGVGGQEAMLFAADIFNMYRSLCLNYGQNFQLISQDSSEDGGYQKAVAHIHFGDLEFGKIFLNESGIHRVQRVPTTDKYGRIHTSTVSVAVLPVSDEAEVDIPENDLEITAVRKASGKGGQKVNKTASAIRIKHKPTGKVVESSSSRSQLTNKELALTHLKAKLSQEKFGEQKDLITNMRRQQIRNSERSDKIRTYNFHKDRVTDHRIGFSSANVSQFMDGNVALYELMKMLMLKFEADAFDVLIQSLLEEGKSFFDR